MTTSSTKHAVRIPIVTRYRLSRLAWSSVRASGALVTDWRGAGVVAGRGHPVHCMSRGSGYPAVVH